MDLVVLMTMEFVWMASIFNVITNIMTLYLASQFHFAQFCFFLKIIYF